MINATMMQEIEKLIDPNNYQSIEDAWGQVGVSIKKRRDVSDGWHRRDPMTQMPGADHYVSGLMHRDGGPAEIYDGYPEYNRCWINGIKKNCLECKDHAKGNLGMVFCSR